MIRSEKKYQSYFEGCTYVVLSKTLLCLIITIALYAILECYHVNQYSDLTHNTWEVFYRITSTFLTGFIISISFYYIVVNIPDRHRHFIVKSNLRKMYIIIKQDILVQIIYASQKGGIQGISNDSDTINGLMTVDGFRSAFAGGTEAHEGWYAFQNGLGKDLQPLNVEPYREDDRILIGFLWQMFSGWSWAEGRLGYDPIEKIIEEI